MGSPRSERRRYYGMDSAAPAPNGGIGNVAAAGRGRSRA
jgi:hypothetical protein